MNTESFSAYKDDVTDELFRTCSLLAEENSYLLDESYQDCVNDKPLMEQCFKVGVQVDECVGNLIDKHVIF